MKLDPMSCASASLLGFADSLGEKPVRVTDLQSSRREAGLTELPDSGCRHDTVRAPAVGDDARVLGEVSHSLGEFGYGDIDRTRDMTLIELRCRPAID